MSEKLKSFTIKDATKKQVGQARGPKNAPAEAAPSSVGFPKIEAIVESAPQSPELAELEARKTLLEGLVKGAKNPKDKLAYQRAHKAYEKTKALLDGLLATKARMSGG